VTLPSSQQAGRSMVEVLVAMTIGLVVLGAVMMSTAGTGGVIRTGDELARLGDDGQTALNILTSQLRMAGYSPPRQQVRGGDALRHYDGVPLRGCDHGFVSVTADAVDALACAAPGGAGHAAVSILYEADVFDTYPGTAGRPTNCLGNQLGFAESALGQYTLAENRFFIRTQPATGNPALYCAASSGAGFSSQPLVDNVESLVMTWGVADPVTDKLGRRMPAGDAVRDLTAAEIDTLYADDPLRWSRVVRVRICLVMRSPKGLAAEAVAHTGCDGKTVMPADAADRRLRRAMSATVHLRNRSGDT
jgi:type IV pilus assembly protein PilW